MEDTHSLPPEPGKTPEVIATSGNGKAYQAVAQAAALAAQDAADKLRDINTIETTADGVAMAEELDKPLTPEMQALIVDEIKSTEADPSKEISKGAGKQLKD